MSDLQAKLKKQHGAVSWTELMTTDIDGARKFYSTLFNWELNEPSSEMPYTMASAGGEEVAGMMPIPEEATGMPAKWGAYVTVDDVEASAKQTVELGGNVLIPPQDIPEVGRFCVISDPQGATLSLITYFDKG